MSVEIRRPRVLATHDIFLFWLKNLEREKPYLVVKRRRSQSLEEHRTVEVWYKIKHEMGYLSQKLLDLDTEIIDLELRDTNKYQFTKLTTRIFELKKEVYNTKDKLKQLAKQSPESKKLLMTYKLFHEITCTFNRKSVEAIIDGETLNLGNRLGFIKIKRIDRFAPSIDWPASKQRKQELISEGEIPKGKENPDGKLWFVYRMSNFYLRWSWTKRFRAAGIPMLRNGKLYAFYPTASSSGDNGKTRVLGTKGLLHKANTENPLLNLRYETVTS